jgi:hypothetical protein
LVDRLFSPLVNAEDLVADTNVQVLVALDRTVVVALWRDGNPLFVDVADKPLIRSFPLLETVIDVTAEL